MNSHANFSATASVSASVAAISLREETKAFLHMQMGVANGGEGELSRGRGGGVYGTQRMKINRLNSTNTYANRDTYSGVHMVHSHVKKKLIIIIIKKSISKFFFVVVVFFELIFS